MYNDQKKPGALPGKNKAPRKRTRITATQRGIHRLIALQSAHSMQSGRPWCPGNYPELYRLVEAAKTAALSRRRLRGRIVFGFAGKDYAARFTNLDRIIVEDKATGRFIASSGFFAL